MPTDILTLKQDSSGLDWEIKSALAHFECYIIIVLRSFAFAITLVFRAFVSNLHFAVSAQCVRVPPGNVPVCQMACPPLGQL